MPFFPTPSPLPPSPLSGCVRRTGRSGGTATPPVIRDGPDSHTTKTRYGTASAAASAATEEGSATDVTVPTPAPPGRLPPLPGGRDPPPLDRCDDGGRRGNGGGEYGDRDNVDACDRHRRVVHWAGAIIIITSAVAAPRGQ